MACVGAVVMRVQFDKQKNENNTIWGLVGGTMPAYQV
jgi:hypothetical protein